MSEALLVVAPAIPTPMELVPLSFMQELESAETKVAGLTITDPASAQTAADMQRALTKAKTALEKARTELKAPLLTLGRAIDATAAGPAQRLEALTRTLKTRQVAYDDEQRRIAAEEERKRQAEIRRLEEERREKLRELEAKAAAEVAENKRIADELAAKNAALSAPASVEEDLDLADDAPPPVEKTETQKEIEAIKYAPLPIAPAVVAPKTQGLSFRTTLKLTVTDVNALPESFVTKTANLGALRAVYTSPWREGQPIPEVPGCKFEIDRQPVTR